MSSFISVDPQSRVLLESHTNTLLAQFDTQLQIITDRYLAVFQERSRRFTLRPTSCTDHEIFRRSIEET